MVLLKLILLNVCLKCEINSISDEVKTTTLSSLKEKKSKEVMEKEVGVGGTTFLEQMVESFHQKNNQRLDVLIAMKSQINHDSQEFKQNDKIVQSLLGR